MTDSAGNPLAAAQRKAANRMAAEWRKAWREEVSTDSADGFRPMRGDEVEAWIKRRRDEMPRTGDEWATLDWMLDEYRERADTGTPLSGEVGRG